jgi:hypothetical protein
MGYSAAVGLRTFFPARAVLATVLAFIWSMGALLVPPAARVRADDSGASVGKCVSDAGSLLRSKDGSKAWQAVGRDGPLASGDQLLSLPGQRGELEVKDGAVRLALVGNSPELSPAPVLECAVTLQSNPEADLDFTLERGRAVVSNRREKGAARVQVRFAEHSWVLSVDEGSSVALELYQRWPRGAPFTSKPGPEDVPGTAVIVWVLKGEMSLKVPGEQYSMHAPPGPAYFRWDNLSGADAGPKRRDKLPSWAGANGEESSKNQPLLTALEQQRRRLAEKPAHTVLVADLDGGDSSARRLAVYGLAALGDLPRTVQSLGDPKHPEVREAAFDALRHWIGRGTGQNLALYHFLINRRKYTPSQAEIILQFLQGFSDRDRVQPETYETMIAYLQSGKLAIRQLAKWQLDQWVPEGKKIAYDPAGPQSERDRAYEEWKKLVPRGQLPPKPKAEEKKT